MSDDDLTIIGAVTASGREQFGRDLEFVEHVDAYFPEDWRRSRRTAENVLTVIERYLEYGDAPPEERFEQACRRAATVLGKQEDTVRRSCGQRLYDEAIGRTYTDLFLDDLIDFEGAWNEYRVA